MKNLNYLFSLLILAGTSACSGSSNKQEKISCELSAPSPYSASSDAEYEKLVANLNGYSLGNDVSGRPSWLQAEEILPRLHPWFQKGKTFCTESYDDIMYVKLATIPVEVATSISSHSGIQNNGIGLLNGKFWANIRFIQNLGIKVGFIENSGAHEFAGFFSNVDNLIAFDILANPGTPKHELRHYQQYKSVEKTRNENNQLSPLGYQCIYEASRFFGELDANTYQMDSWIGAFEFDKSPRDISKVSPLFFPQGELFLGYLNYPFLASKWLEKADCPMSFIKVIQNITKQTEVFHSKVQGVASKIQHRSTVYFQHLNNFEKNCAENVSNIDCERLATEISNYQKFMSSAKTWLYNELSQEAQLRPQYINKLLKELDPDVQKQLLNKSGGFKFLLELKGYSNEK